MDSSFITATKAAFDGAVAAVQQLPSVSRLDYFAEATLRGRFEENIEPIVRAIASESISRRIALAELRKAIDEGLESILDGVEKADDYERQLAQFWPLVMPWLLRLER